MIRYGIRFRLVVAFMALALLVGVGTALAGFAASERIGAYLVEWHVSPIMDMLIEAEERAWLADSLRRRPERRRRLRLVYRVFLKINNFNLDAQSPDFYTNLLNLAKSNYEGIIFRQSLSDWLIHFQEIINNESNNN